MELREVVKGLEGEIYLAVKMENEEKLRDILVDVEDLLYSASVMCNIKEHKAYKNILHRLMEIALDESFIRDMTFMKRLSHLTKAGFTAFVFINPSLNIYIDILKNMLKKDRIVQVFKVYDQYLYTYHHKKKGNIYLNNKIVIRYNTMIRMFNTKLYSSYEYKEAINELNWYFEKYEYCKLINIEGAKYNDK